MENVFDLVNIVFLVLAVVVFLKLRSVLGRRTGHERRPQTDHFTGRDTSVDAKVGVDVKTGADKSSTESVSSAEGAHQWGARDKSDWGSASQGLVDISEVDSEFTPEGFLSGAQAAHELIVNAFPRGDRETLRGLLSAQVFESFDSIITQREERVESVEYSFVGLKSADIVKAVIIQEKAQVTVKFVSEMTSCVKDGEGRVIEGDAISVREAIDVWTFERSVNSRNPNWKLVATSAAH
ncbi:MAG: Tim44/TimA family putative adaptor protein [Parvularculales bacterium]